MKYSLLFLFSISFAITGFASVPCVFLHTDTTVLKPHKHGWFFSKFMNDSVPRYIPISIKEYRVKGIFLVSFGTVRVPASIYMIVRGEQLIRKSNSIIVTPPNPDRQSHKDDLKRNGLVLITSGSLTILGGLIQTVFGVLNLRTYHKFKQPKKL